MALDLSLWSTTPADNDDADPGINWGELQAPSSVNNSARAMMAVAARDRIDNSGQLNSTGSSNAYALTTQTEYMSLTDGRTVAFTANFANTGSATLNVNSIGASPIVRTDGSALAANDIKNSQVCKLIYKSGAAHWRLTSAGLAVDVGTMAIQNANNVNITGGNIVATNVTATNFASGNVNITGGSVNVAGFAAGYATIFDGNVSLSALSASNFASGNVNITGGGLSGVTVDASYLTSSNIALTGGTIYNVDITAGSISGITDLAVADGGTGASNASGARTNLGLGTIATQAASSVAITGGSVTGVTDIAVADGGTGASDASGARTNLGLVIGTNVQAQNANLEAIAGVTSASDKIAYFTGSGTASVADFSSFGRSLVDDSNASAARTTLGLGTIATQAASNVAITGGAISGVTLAASTISGTTLTLSSKATIGYDLKISEGGGGAVDSIAIGSGPILAANTTGAGNIAIGYNTLVSNVGGYSNIAIGPNSLYYNVNGYRNVAVGTSCAVNTQGHNNTFLGYVAGNGSTSEDNVTCLGSFATITGSNQVQLGDSATTTYAWGAVQNRSDGRDKAEVRDTALGLDFVLSLRPVDYKVAYREDGGRVRKRFHHGFIAQEVKAAADAAGMDFGGFQDHSINGGKDVLSLGYGEFFAPFARAIKELHARIADLEKEQRNGR